MKRALSAIFALSAPCVLAEEAFAYCPSYTPAQTAGGQNCGVDPVPGMNPSVSEWNAIFVKVAPGKASWGNDGPDVQKIGSGCGKPTPMTTVDARFPCHVLKAIAWVESGWRQFCVPDAPQGSIGAPERTIVSFDCGYGVAQVTSGMHVGETPSFDRKRVAAEPTYNLATGTRILAGKWAATECVGDNNPDIVEDWYSAIWAYNGLSYQNNPNNPNLTPGRGVYDPKNGGSYAYQEKVLGYMEHPPDAQHWKVLAAAYPNRGDLGNSGVPPAIPEPSCASPTSCAQMRMTHTSACADSPDGGVGDGGAVMPYDDAGRPIDAAPPMGDGGDHLAAGAGCSCDASATRPSPLALLLALLLLRRRGASRGS
jgi:hypothetical protein